ncbi:retrovirus-related pol polyprotein from transposon TNT 1-94 [Tanacetum coccineum]|uniref:Retrovirus-related pol polyprotein from transposon TNT 1-94 n=1 Tax=Tanacetum coccineum TaxID=301880 RepID=A0ABQ4ZZC8_9ASTR
MHNNIMAAGSRDRPPMLAIGRYAQWRSRTSRKSINLPTIPQNLPSKPGNKNVDTTPRYKNDNQTGQFGNQRAVNVVRARETVGGQVVQHSGIQCFNCKKFGHYAKECRKPKRVKDSTYHKEKMLLCKQAEKGVQIQAEQSDWLADTDEEIDEQELEAHYSYMAKIQEVPNVDSSTDAEPLKHVQYDTDDNDDQHDVECDDEHVALANLIANLKLDVDENKKIQKQLKKANATLTQELTECKSIIVETSRTLGESNIDYDKLECKLNETLGLLAQEEIDIKEGLKVKAYKISVVKEKQDELVRQSLLTKSHYEGLVKEKTKVITDLKLKEEKDIDKIISMENQLKPTFANPMYLKKAQYEKPCLYAIPHDQSDPANRLIPDREEIQTLEEESRSKLNKDLVKPFDIQKIVDQAWVKHSNDRLHLRNPTAQDMEIIVKTCLMPLALKTQNDSFTFVHELKQEMHADLKYVESLEDEIDELESDKAEFSNMYDMLLQECVSNDIMCSYLQSSSDLDEITELQCLYLHKVRECDCLAQKLSEQTEFVSKEIYTELLRSFAKLEKHSISLEIALQQCQEQLKNDTVCKEKASNVFRKEREQYFEIQDLKGQLQDKNIAIIDYDKLERKLNETLGLLAQKEIDIKEGLKVKAYEISVVKEKHDELVKQSLLTKSHYEGLVKEKTKVITDLKLKEEKDIDKMISMENQLKFLNEIVYKRSQSIQTIHMLAPKCPTFNGRPTFANPMYLKRLNYYESLEDEIDEVESDKAKFSNMYDMILQECVSNDIMCSYLQSSSDLDEITELQCLYLHKVKEYDCLAQKLSEYQQNLYAHRTNVSRPQPRSNQMKDKVLPNTSQVKFKKTEVEDHPRISSISNQTKSVTACNDSLNSRTSNVNAVCATCGKYLYTISLQETTSSTPICLMAKASPTQAWLWHRRLSYLNFDYINLLSKKDVVIGLLKLKYVKNQICSSCEVSKAKRISFKSKTVPSSKGWLNLLHMDLCGPMRVASINGKKYIPVIVDDYSRYTWTLFLHSKDETTEVLKDFLTMIQRNLQAPVISVRTDRGTEFLNKTLNAFFKEEGIDAFFKEEGIEHQTSTPRTPEQNGVVERRNRTLIKAARTMLSAFKLPLFFWAKAIATACYTQRKMLDPQRNFHKSFYKMIFDEIKEIQETSVANDTSGLIP